MEQVAWPERFELLDGTTRRLSEHILFPFALDEIVTREVGAGRPPLVHLWTHPKAFVIGLRDNRLPRAAEAKRWLEDAGYQVAVRNSGGAAVPLDPGVVNLSFMLPNQAISRDFRDDFGIMAELVAGAIEGGPSIVDKGEIRGAYCPGDFDLSIGGRKFCGIAQRRLANAHAVQAFVVVDGNGGERAELVRRFYEIASGGAGESDYPIVELASMASLAELAGMKTASGFIAGIRRCLKAKNGFSEITENRLPLDSIHAMIPQLKMRYDK